MAPIHFLSRYIKKINYLHFVSEVSTDFDFEFSRKLGRGASIVEMRQNLTAFTVAFWLKVANTEIDPGTPLSYAVEVGGNISFHLKLGP